VYFGDGLVYFHLALTLCPISLVEMAGALSPSCGYGRKPIP
jgi:hypothetical protein